MDLEPYQYRFRKLEALKHDPLPPGSSRLRYPAGLSQTIFREPSRMLDAFERRRGTNLIIHRRAHRAAARAYLYRHHHLPLLVRTLPETIAGTTS
jgi:hypothetical protein